MQRRRRSSSCALALLLAIASAMSGISAFSFSRTLHDVEQNFAEEANLHSQEMRLNTPELNLDSSRQVNKFSSTLSAFNQRAEIDLNDLPLQKNQLARYVTIRSSPSGYVTVPKGHRLELKCEVDGTPPPRIYWVMGENPERQLEQLERESVADVSYTAIGREVSKLVIDCVTQRDQSLVHCVGIAGDQIAISQPTVLHVNGRNDTTGAGRECQGGSNLPIITRHRPLYFSEIGSTVVLPCEANGNPRPRIYWLDSEGNQLMDPRFTLQSNGDLLISNIRWQDMDGYKCLAKSPLGETEAVTFLYPAAKSESEKRKANAL